MRSIIVVLVMLLAAGFRPVHSQATKRRPTPMVSSPQEIARAIQQMESELRIATMKGDAAWFEEHLAESYIDTDAQGKVSSRKELIHLYRTTSPEYDTWNLSEGTAQTFNGDTVILTGKIELQGTVQGKSVSGTFRFTRVWIKQGLVWELAASQMTRMEG